jgi:cytosine/adenosine deaminase-related metal-dependent hydrolase
MLLCNVSIVGDKNATPKDILVENGCIRSITENGSNAAHTDNSIVFDNAIAFPGLINSHDHLDFNLFPQLGNTVYNNYREWGNDIHSQYAKEIAAVLRVPKSLRILWGMYKNLLNGFTTVINHGEKLPVTADFLSVCQEYSALHSVGFEKNWRWKLNWPGKYGKPVVIHIGEGTDPASAREIDSLIRWNLAKRSLIGVHGVAMNAKQASSFQSLVWCPASNFFLLNKTAAVDQLKQRTNILFGSDSTLTAGWNIWDHLRAARQTNMLTDDELLQTISGRAGETWGLNKGAIQQGYLADIVVVKKNGHTDPMEAFYATDPKDLLLVTHKGQIQLFDAIIYEQVNPGLQKSFCKININGSYKYVAGDLETLCNQIRQFYPEIESVFEHIKPNPHVETN